MADKSASLSDQAYEIIKGKILDLSYAPGQALTETMLSKELNMSRSPIRSAIRQLKAEGLIENDYYKSTIVKPITEKDINEIYQLRELLELTAFRHIFKSNQHEQYSYKIEEKVVRMCAVADDPYKWELADTQMHLTIVKALNNDRITRVYENNLDELIRIGQFSVKHGMPISTTNENLKKMVYHMRNADYESAVHILKTDHFTTGKSRALIPQETEKKF